jgi:hypothetical protein
LVNDSRGLVKKESDPMSSAATRTRANESARFRRLI